MRALAAPQVRRWDSRERCAVTQESREPPCLASAPGEGLARASLLLSPLGHLPGPAELGAALNFSKGIVVSGPFLQSGDGALDPRAVEWKL